jgi:hypothetical protein
MNEVLPSEKKVMAGPVRAEPATVRNDAGSVERCESLSPAATIRTLVAGVTVAAHCKNARYHGTLSIPGKRWHIYACEHFHSDKEDAEACAESSRNCDAGSLMAEELQKTIHDAR